MTVNAANTTISGITTDAQKTNASTQTLSNDFNDFLQLLTVQLQNQDPLNPMDTNEFTNQLVQFSQVEQQINTNQKLDSLVSLQLSSSISAALGYVGLNANYISNDLYFDGTNPGQITYSLPETASVSKMVITDDQGQEVFSRTIPGTAGKHDVVWDGKDAFGNVMPRGTYNIRIDALNADDKPVKSTVVVQGMIRGVETQDGQILLLVGDRAVPMANVLNAAKPNV
jgi:flagellar basal-body rod modification protein FlgD